MLTNDNFIAEFNRLQETIPRALDAYRTFPNVNIGACKKDVIYQENKMTLYHYKPLVKETNKIPLLIVFALINRPYILDLISDYSMIKKILSAGIGVYLIDWGYPDQNNCSLTLNKYVNGYIKKCVEVVCKNSSQKKINLLGVCQGGVFSVCYSSLYPQHIKNLITMVTPIDFHTSDNTLTNFAKNINVDLLVDTMGNIPGLWLAHFFLSLIPSLMIGKKYLDFVNMLDNPGDVKRFLAMEKWIFDCPDQAGEAFREFIKDCYQHNKLIKAEMKLGRRKVNLQKLNMPILNIIAENDRLVSKDSSLALKKYVATDDYTEQIFPGGHIGIYVSNKTQAILVPAMIEWINQRK